MTALRAWRVRRMWTSLWVAGGLGLGVIPTSLAATNLVLWDTSVAFGAEPQLRDRTGWRAVPANLLALEQEPLRAASDPGYYGREYAFQGDAVVENQHLVAAFWGAQGRVALFAQPQRVGTAGVEGSGANSLKKIGEWAPLGGGVPAGKLSRYALRRQAGGELVLEAFFAAPGVKSVSAVFTFGTDAIVQIKPGADLGGSRLVGPLEYGIAPGFIGDDLIYSAKAYPAAEALWVPAEHMFLALPPGGENVLTLTWAVAGQPVKLTLRELEPGKRGFESLEFRHEGQSLFLGVASAPGLWHREALTPAFLEKDVAIPWSRPFAATWKTQLPEAGVRTTFAFRQAKGQIWRGVPGMYTYPVWFDGERAWFHLTKKVPPKGEAVIYCLEGGDAPLPVATPAEVLKATLGRATAEAMLDPLGRQLRTHHRRGAEGIRRACTCGCTEAIQAVFEAGQEVERKDSVEGAVGDMVFFVQRHFERIAEYQRFAAEVSELLAATRAAQPELASYLEAIDGIVRRIPEEGRVQKENLKSLEHAAELARKTLALTSRKDPGNLPAYLELGKLWRDMGGAGDYVVAQCHTLTRRLDQEAGYAAARQPKAISVAREVRRRCRQCLRNSDGYEIWPDY